MNDKEAARTIFCVLVGIPMMGFEMLSFPFIMGLGLIIYQFINLLIIELNKLNKNGNSEERNQESDN